jgi:hypothetical protein
LLPSASSSRLFRTLKSFITTGTPENIYSLNVVQQSSQTPLSFGCRIGEVQPLRTSPSKRSDYYIAESP